MSELADGSTRPRSLGRHRWPCALRTCSRRIDAAFAVLRADPAYVNRPPERLQITRVKLPEVGLPGVAREWIALFIAWTKSKASSLGG